MTVRVRYAPSPTGLQHIGSLRTALFNYFYAKSHGGQCILRIEDTDQSRFDPRSLDDIFETFQWLGINFDGAQAPYIQGKEQSPYIVQSERKEVYTAHALMLLETGNAYKCFCSSERLASLREEQQKTGAAQGYDRHCRALRPDDWARREAAGEKAVIRFKVPENGTGIKMSDGVLGTVKRAYKDISPDPVLLKSDGLPTYHLASVVDDHLLEISHVIRAQEWLSSLALHHLLYRAFGWEAPQFLHLPMVLGKDGKKLSKRHGATSVAEFRKEGYLPEALLNYVVTLGWSHGDRELFTKKDLETMFADGSINKSAATFNYKKLQWFNAQYIKRESNERLVDLCLPYLQERGMLGTDNALLHAVMPLAKERMKLLSDIPNMVGFLFADVVLEDSSAIIKKNQEPSEALAALRAVRADFENIFAIAREGNDEGFHAFFEALAQKMGCGLGRVMMPLRMAITGSAASPPLSDSIRLVGKEKSYARLEAAIAVLDKA